MQAGGFNRDPGPYQRGDDLGESPRRGPGQGGRRKLEHAVEDRGIEGFDAVDKTANRVGGRLGLSIAVEAVSPGTAAGEGCKAAMEAVWYLAAQDYADQLKAKTAN